MKLTCHFDRDGNFKLVAVWVNGNDPHPGFLKESMTMFRTDDIPLDIFDSCEQELKDNGFTVDDPDVNDDETALQTEFEMLSVTVETSIFLPKLCSIHGHVTVSEDEKEILLRIESNEYHAASGLEFPLTAEQLSRWKIVTSV